MSETDQSKRHLERLLEIEKKYTQHLRTTVIGMEEKIREQERIIVDLRDMLELVALSYSEKMARFDEMGHHQAGLTRAVKAVQEELKVLQENVVKPKKANVEEQKEEQEQEKV